VIALGIREDELARELDDTVEGDTGVGEDAGGGEEGFVTEELSAL
jgi:hypothetical protein